MCLAIIAVGVLPDWPLIVAANRDEYHARATASLQPWGSCPNLLAGQDLLAGGTWLGATTSGRFSLLTNYRNALQQVAQAPSRGRLVEDFLKASVSAQAYLRHIEPRASDYNGFNLIVADQAGLFYAGNQAQPFRQTLMPGVYGLSNALLDTPWPKTQQSRQAIATLLAQPVELNPQRLVDVLQDRCGFADQALPNTGIGIERERLLAPPFIVSPNYGTRCTTVVMRHRNGNQWVQESTFNAAGETVQWVGWLSLQARPWRCLAAWPGIAKIASSAIA